MTLKTRYRYQADKTAFVVPIVTQPDGSQSGRLPQHLGGSHHYAPGRDDLCVVIVGPGGHRYLSQRSYARFIGWVQYNPDGYGHFDLSPDVLDRTWVQQ